MKQEELVITREALIKLINMAYQGGWDTAWMTLQEIRGGATLDLDKLDELLKSL